MKKKLPPGIGEYADHEITELTGTKVPLFLKLTYFVLPIWGIIWFFLYWNGSQGWLDRGYWQELQDAANTRTQKEQVQAPKKQQENFPPK